MLHLAELFVCRFVVFVPVFIFIKIIMNTYHAALWSSSSSPDDNRYNNGLGVEAVEEPFGPRLGASLPLAVRQQRKQSITWVTGVPDNFMGFPLTLPIIYVLDCRKLGPSDVLGCTHHPL